MITLLHLVGALSLFAATALLIMGSLKKEGDPGKIGPNPATFLIRSIVAWVNLATFMSGSETTIIKCGVLFASATGLSVIFLMACWIGRWKMVRWYDIACLIVALGILWIWQHTDDAVSANLILQVALTLSFVPSVIGSYKFRERQRWHPWTCAAVAYVFMTVAIVGDPKGFQLFQLVNPIVPGIMGNGLLAILAYRQELRAKQTIIGTT
jgi:hypothetical protein